MRYILIALTALAAIGSIRPAIAQLNPDPTSTPIDRAPTENSKPPESENEKSELGDIRIIKRPPQVRPQPNVQLLVRSSVFSSSNTTALDSFRRSDAVFINSAQLLATPKLGDSTRLIASVGGGITRFASGGASNYNFVDYNVAIQQSLAPRTFGQLGWVQDTLYQDSDGRRVLRDNAVQFIVGRQDQLGEQLRLDSFYELKASFSDPNDQSRLTNTIGARVRYDITPTVQSALDYRLTFRNFTQSGRSDTEQQITALLIYNISPDVFLTGSASYLFGRSSQVGVNLDNLSFGLGLGFNVPLF